jgi:hypothetical protein
MSSSYTSSPPSPPQVCCGTALPGFNKLTTRGSENSLVRILSGLTGAAFEKSETCSKVALVSSIEKFSVQLADRFADTP